MKKVELLFPELCNIYGESYNVEYLRRCSDEIEVINTNHMDTPAFVNEDVDMIYLGCTTERKQEQNHRDTESVSRQDHRTDR